MQYIGKWCIAKASNLNTDLELKHFQLNSTNKTNITKYIADILQAKVLLEEFCTVSVQAIIEDLLHSVLLGWMFELRVLESVVV